MQHRRPRLCCILADMKLRGQQPFPTHRTESGNILSGVFTPVLANQSKSFNLIDTLSVGLDRIQRNFEPM